MLKSLSRGLFAFLCIGTGLYPLLYFIIDPTFALLRLKPAELLLNIWWQIGFNTHIILGGIALAIGWVQFSARWRNANLKRHRFIGRIYMIATVLSATAGMYIAQYATGGLIAALGFFCLGLVWFYTTFFGFWSIREYNVESHRKWMIFSFAACFAAVTLRIWLPLLELITGDFITAYRIVAWLCWVPNILIAWLIVVNQKHIEEVVPEYLD